MSKLKQNNLEEATTELGFLSTINEGDPNLKATLVREVELEDGTIVNVEGMTPYSFKTLFTQRGADVTFLTPGENHETYEGEVISGIVQAVNPYLDVESSNSDDIEPEETTFNSIVSDEDDIIKTLEDEDILQ